MLKFRVISTQAGWCSGITSVSHTEGREFEPRIGQVSFCACVFDAFCFSVKFFKHKNRSPLGIQASVSVADFSPVFNQITRGKMKVLLVFVLLWTHSCLAYINCDNATDTFWLRSDQLSMNFQDYGPSFKLDYYNGTSSGFYLKMTFNTILETENDTNSWDFDDLDFSYECTTQMAPWNNSLVYSDTITWNAALSNGATVSLVFSVYPLGTNITGFYNKNESLSLKENSFGLQFGVINWQNSVSGSK